jgi:hypothetical protein
MLEGEMVPKLLKEMLVCCRAMTKLERAKQKTRIITRVRMLFEINAQAPSLSMTDVIYACI